LPLLSLVGKSALAVQSVRQEAGRFLQPHHAQMLCHVCSAWLLPRPWVSAAFT